MTQLRLAQPRDVGALFRDSLATFFRHAGVFVLLSAAVVVPVHVVVEGIGMEMLTGPYEDSPSVAEAAVPTIVGFLVVAPIITAICIHALRSIAAGEKIGAGQAFVSGFEAFTPLFFAVLLAAIGIAAGFALLILPGIFLAVKLFFVPQAVVIGEHHGHGRSAPVLGGHPGLLVAHVRARHPGQHCRGATGAVDHRALREHRVEH